MFEAQLNDKLVAWCVLYGGGMVFIGGRIYARLHLYGSLMLDDWLMIAAAIAYTGCMITEIFIFLALRGMDITTYISVHDSISARNPREADASG